MWQILLAHPNYETGGARQSAVAAQPMHVWRVCQLKSGFKYPDHSNNCTFSPVRAILKPQEASKVKFACFKGIVHPTDIHGSWGTWLPTLRLCSSGFPLGGSTPYSDRPRLVVRLWADLNIHDWWSRWQTLWKHDHEYADAPEGERLWPQDIRNWGVCLTMRGLSGRTGPPP